MVYNILISSDIGDIEGKANDYNLECHSAILITTAVVHEEKLQHNGDGLNVMHRIYNR